jgi:hypothetical protein
VLWGRLCLPLRLSPEDDRVAVLLYCHPIEDKASIYRTLFEHSNSGIIIAAPIKNEAGDIVNAWLIAQNNLAAEMARVVENDDELLMRSYGFFSRDDVWRHVTSGVEASPKMVVLNDLERGVMINVYAELVDEYLAVRLTLTGGVIHTILIERDSDRTPP